jgi:YVTN family beta-propeller protein
VRSIAKVLFTLCALHSAAVPSSAQTAGEKIWVVERFNDTVALIDTASGVVEARLSVPAGPGSIGILPDGSRVYVSSHTAAQVSVIDTTTLAIVSTIAVPALSGSIIVPPDGSAVFLATGSGAVLRISPATNTIDYQVNLGGVVVDLTTNADGSRLFATTWSPFASYVLDSATGAVLAVANHATGSLQQIAGTGSAIGTEYFANAVRRVNASTLAVEASLAVTEPVQGTLSSDGTVFYFTAFNPDRLVAVRTDTLAVVGVVSLPAGSTPFFPRLSADGKRLFVSLSAADKFAVIDVSTLQVERFIQTAARPQLFVVIGAPDTPDTTAPILTVPSSITVEANGPAGSQVPFAVSATDETDGPVPVTCTAVSGQLFALGTHTVACTASDDSENTASAQFTVTVVDTTAPQIQSLTVDVPALWPPNHEFRTVSVAPVAVDAIDNALACHIVSVTSSESATARGSGATEVDAIVDGPLTLRLRAERSGTDSGRTYSIVVECTDDSGNTARQSTSVVVRHSVSR